MKLIKIPEQSHLCDSDHYLTVNDVYLGTSALKAIRAEVLDVPDLSRGDLVTNWMNDQTGRYVGTDLDNRPIVQLADHLETWDWDELESVREINKQPDAEPCVEHLQGESVQ